MCVIERNELLTEIRNHPFWYHSFDLCNGERIAGSTESEKLIPKTGL